MLGSHPEYWSATMRQNLVSYLAAGGRVIYTGGNGMYERVQVNAAGNALTFRNSAGNRDLFQNLVPSQDPTLVLGVDINIDAYMDFYPYKVITAHPLLNGTSLNVGDTFGTRIDGFGARIDGLGSTVSTRIDGLSDMFGTRIEGLGSTVSDRLGQLDGRLETANGQFTGVNGQLEALGRELATVGRLVDTSTEQLAGQIEPLADELRSRPGPMDIQDILAKIVDAAQNDVATQLGSLEETVLTLAEALLRPNGQARFQERTRERAQERTELRPAPAPSDGAEV